MYIDASEKAMGRLSSITAKSLLNGNHIIILNAEKALITGKNKMRLTVIKNLCWNT